MRNRERGITRSWVHHMTNCFEPGIPPSTIRRMYAANEAIEDHFDDADLQRVLDYDPPSGWEPWGCGCDECMEAAERNGNTNIPPFRTDLLV